MNTKDWTILIYANGNNELEPEIWNSVIALESTAGDENMNVIIQVARESRDLVRIMRPFDQISNESNAWKGVRRYKINAKKLFLLQNLYNHNNMADYHNLYDFIKWGVKNYPAKHFSLILSGHGASYIAVLSDYSQELPAMMSSYNMCEAINQIYLDTGIQIDLLILDICKMNQLEIIYQLGRSKINTVKYLLTYIGDGPIGGIPYGKIIEKIKLNLYAYDLKSLITQIINSIDLNLVAIEIDHSKLSKIREYINRILSVYLDSGAIRKNNSSTLDILFNKNTPYYNEVIRLKNTILSLLNHSNQVSSEQEDLIDIGAIHILNSNPVNNMLSIYTQFDFVRESRWIKVLKNKMGESLIPNTIYPQKNHLLILTRQGLKKIISAANPVLGEEEIDLILDRLLAYKRWIKT